MGFSQQIRKRIIKFQQKNEENKYPLSKNIQRQNCSVNESSNTIPSQNNLVYNSLMTHQGESENSSDITPQNLYPKENLYLENKRIFNKKLYRENIYKEECIYPKLTSGHIRSSSTSLENISLN